MNPDWSRSYAGQQEILDYMDKMAEHYGLTDKIEFGRKAVKSVWNPGTYRWHVQLDSGEVNHELSLNLYYQPHSEGCRNVMFSQVSVYPWAGRPHPSFPGHFCGSTPDSGPRSFPGGPRSQVLDPLSGGYPSSDPRSFLGEGASVSGTRFFPGVLLSQNRSTSQPGLGVTPRPPPNRRNQYWGIPPLDGTVSPCYAVGGMPLLVSRRSTFLFN